MLLSCKTKLAIYCSSSSPIELAITWGLLPYATCLPTLSYSIHEFVSICAINYLGRPGKHLQRNVSLLHLQKILRWKESSQGMAWHDPGSTFWNLQNIWILVNIDEHVNDVENVDFPIFQSESPSTFGFQQSPRPIGSPRFALWLQDTEFTTMLEEADVDAWCFFWMCWGSHDVMILTKHIGHMKSINAL